MQRLVALQQEYMGMFSSHHVKVSAAIAGNTMGSGSAPAVGGGSSR